jgi:hypothetical protein
MSKSSRWERWIFPLTKDTDTVFCSAVVAELRRRGPWSEAIGLAFDSGDYKKVIEFPTPFSAEVDDFRSVVQIRALFSKNADLELGYDPLKAAVEASIKAELQCRGVNRYFGSLCPFGGVVTVVSRARRKIAEVLGPVPALERLKPRFGPGASTTIKRSEACWEGKLQAPIVCSEDLLPYVHSFLPETASWTWRHALDLRPFPLHEDGSTVGGNVPVVVDVGKLIFVEKNAKTHRPICVEPLLNGFWQLGVGDYIKDRLRVRAHQDLTDQSRNQRLAREGSVTGKLATIDLSSASDTLAFSVVFDLLPEPWVDLLSKLRTGIMSYSGQEYELEKFSSMGNGFTFELETLIFWSLAQASTEVLGEDTNKVSIYGDDIIVPSRVCDLLVAALTWCGFNVNTEKSFWEGPFRESCGADWLLGDDVRPIFKKDRLSYQWLFTFHNWAIRNGEISLARIARGFIPKEWTMFGPDGYGDGHLLGSYELIKPRAARRAGWEAGYFHTLRETSRSIPVDPEIAALTGLYDLYVQGATNYWDPRELRRPGVVPGSLSVERASIYTFTEHIFAR